MEQKNNTAGLTSSVDTSDLTAHQKKNGDIAQAHTSDSANEWYYKKQEAAMNQRYALEAASIQQQMQLEQWNRENRYNDPKAVADRYRAAGINPRAALSGAASGAGLAHAANMGSVTPASSSGSYGTSDISQNINNTSSLMNGINDVIGQGMDVATGVASIAQARANVKYTNAQTNKLEIQNQYEETQILADLEQRRASAKKILADKDTSEAQRNFYEKQLPLIDKQIEQINQNISESASRVDYNDARTGLTQKESKLVDSNIKEVGERTKNYAIERDYKEALTALVSSQKDNIEMDTALKDAQRGHYDKLNAKIESEIKEIASRINLNSAQTKRWSDQTQLEAKRLKLDSASAVRALYTETLHAIAHNIQAFGQVASGVGDIIPF